MLSGGSVEHWKLTARIFECSGKFKNELGMCSFLCLKFAITEEEEFCYIECKLCCQSL